MAIDISNLLGKTENDGTTDAGRLTAKEWNQLVQAVEENQKAVKGAVKGINYNGTPYTSVVDGMLQMTVLDVSGRNAKFEWIQQAPETIAKGGSCVVEFNIIDQVKDENDASKLVSYDQPGKVTFYVDDKQVGTVSGVYDKGYSKYTGPVKFDFSKATTLSTKTDGNVLRVEYTNTGVVLNKYYTVYVLDLSISVENFKTVYSTDSLPNVDVVVRGADSLLYVSVDDNLIVDGRAVRSNIRETIDEEFAQYNTHGVHNLKVWAIPQSFTEVKTDTLSYNYIFGNTASSDPIVMSTITDGAEYELYGKMPVDYVAYLSGEQGTKDINISLENDSDVLLSTTQSIEFINGSGSNSYTFTLFPSAGSDERDFIGNDRKLIISIAGVDGTEYKHTILVNIKESTVQLKQAEGYAVYLSSNGRNNQESASTVRTWKSISDDGNNTEVSVSFDDNIEFLDTGSGWLADTDGNIAMHLQKGKYFTLNHMPFKFNPTYNSGSNNGNGKGLTVSIEFATRNCLNANARVISCMDYTQETTGRGFYVTASEAKLIGSNISLGAKFREDTRIKLDLVIEGTLNKYAYDTVVGTDPSASDYIQKGESDECLALMFIDGVYTGITLIDKNTSFQQGSSTVDAQNIRFGSEDCDLDIYNIRIYDRALNIDEIVNNYSYDTPMFSEKIAIAQRNDIFSSVQNNMPSIDVGKLRKARPELPFFYVDMDPQYSDLLPQNKSDWKLLTMTQWQNPSATSGSADEAMTSFEVLTGTLRNQGTSSMTYPWPWRNWDWKTGDGDFGDKSTFKYYFPDATNTSETSSKWHQYGYTGTGDNLPIKKITLKKDYASSEMCNNAICSEIFTDMAVGVGTAYPNALSPAMKEEITNNKITDYRLSLKAKPCFMFQTLEDPNAEGSAGLGTNAMGMMNLIPNKNEVGYLGFKQNKWENADDGATEREQSWELGDNLDDVFWVKKFDHFQRNSDGTFKNDIKDCYEARTPKDTSVSGWDADFGFTPKGQKTVTNDQAKIIRDETYDIVEFHNWLVSVNQHLADPTVELKAREPWNNDGQGGWLYTHDTKEYRKAKFENEAPDRLILDQWILYYIWREQFWMFDSGFKNLQVYTVGPNPDNPTSSVMQWGCMVRDADTALGIENTGKDYFPPHIEDIDYYTEENGKITFHYGGAKDIYDITELKAKYGEKASAVLNGQFGSIWVNLRDVFGAKIGEMYRTLTNNVTTTHFGAAAAINKFRGHQENWCESLYNFGMRQYFGGAPFSAFNKSALGDKKNSRAQWLERGFYYRRGKYQNLSDNSAFRINTYDSPDTDFDKELKVKAYIPMYLGCGGTTGEMINSKNVIRLIDDTYEDGSYGKPISVGETGFNFPNTGDAVSYIYGTNMITDIGDLARVCKILRIQTLNFPKLRQLNLGHEQARDGKTYLEYATRYITNDKGELVSDGTKGEPRAFTNEILANLDCSSLSQLTLLDVTNHTNLSDLVIDKCTQLQELYARGTILKAINLPATTSLQKVYLGSKLTALELVNLTGINDFVVEGLNDCGRLVVQNCGDYMASKSWELVTLAINKLESVYDATTNPSVCSLRGINWDIAQNDAYTYLERLLNINADLTGKITIKALPNDLKIRLIAKYGDIDNPSNSLYIKYNQVAITKITLPTKMYIYEAGEHQLAFNVTPSNANTYKSATWTLTANQFATIDSKTGVITRNADAADETKYATLTVSIKQMPDTDGEEREELTTTSTVYFYERIAKPGDIVFNDGTYSDELDEAKTPIGVCYYVDPKDKTKRLMCALTPLDNGKSYTWGCNPGFAYPSEAPTNYYGSSSLLNIGDDTYDCYDIKTLANLTSPGIDVVTGTSAYFSDDVYRDATNSANSYFKEFEKSTYYGDLGWKTATNDIKVDGLTLIDGSTSLSIKNGDRVPSGYYNTMAIIQHRNKLLDAYKNTKDQEGAFIRPYSTEDYSELYILNQLMTEAEGWAYEDRTPTLDDTKGSLLYYGAASGCWAYEPKVNNLDDKFKKYNWFLPSSGDLARILYYMYQSYKDSTAQSEPVDSQYDSSYSEPANAFANAIELKKLLINNFVNRTFWSSTENDREDAITINYAGGSYMTNIKFHTASIIPVCKF